MVTNETTLRKLRQAREGMGLTQQEVATKLGMSRPTFIAIEKGVRRLDNAELLKLSQLYAVPVDRLVREDLPEINVTAMFRKQNARGHGDEDERKALKYLTDFTLTSVELERQLGIHPRQMLPEEVDIRKGNLELLAEDSSHLLRQRLGIGSAPIVNLASLAESELGVRIFVTALSSRISGAFAYTEVGPSIILNSNHSLTRQNMTLAHELGHLVGSRSYVDLNVGDHKSSGRDEKFANLFAASLLLPGVWVRRKFSEIVNSTSHFSPRDLVTVANEANVSPEAMCRRLEQLDLLPSGTWESLVERGMNSEFVKKIASNVATSISPNATSRVVRLAISALADQLISEGQLSEKLGLDRIEIRRWIDELQDSLDGGADDDISA